MKKCVWLFVLLTFPHLVFSQKFRFNKKLNNFCITSTKEFDKISSERKVVLDKIALELSEKKNIVFTCYTNTRRTQLLQTWMQTAFYYYGIYNRTSFSYGDTVSEVAPGVIAVLKKSGFVFSETNTRPKKWVFYIGERNQGYVIYPKTTNKLLDDNESVVVNICVEGEPVSTISANSYSLPYVSPRSSEGTPDEKIKYDALNKQISIEMLYLAEKAREIIANSSK